MSATPTQHPKAYVRAAHRSERKDIARVLTRAFAKDPAMNWFGCVPQLVDDIVNPSPRAKRSMRNLSQFQDSLVRAIMLVKGVVEVVVVPRVDEAGANTPLAEGKEKGKSEEAPQKEEVVGVALWLPPGQTLDMNPLTLLRAGILKVLFGWGPRGVKVRCPLWLLCNLLTVPNAATDDRLRTHPKSDPREGVRCARA